MDAKKLRKKAKALSKELARQLNEDPNFNNQYKAKAKKNYIKIGIKEMEETDKALKNAKVVTFKTSNLKIPDREKHWMDKGGLNPANKTVVEDDRFELGMACDFSDETGDKESKECQKK